jgi:two-component system, NarL family, nitrate/nitrite response regulator NarL
MFNVAAPFTVLLVDDQSIILDGIEALLAPVEQVTVVGRATSGMEAVALARSLAPEVIIMDVNMPGMDGIEATRRILKAAPETRVLVLSMYGHKEFVLELLDAGVSGYLLKNAGKAELIEALNTVMTGKRYLAKEIAALLSTGDRFKDRQGEFAYGVLTKREVQVVKLIMQERTTQEIAEALFLSPDTVETHRRNIMHKLDVRNIAGLVKYAMERGWGE